MSRITLLILKLLRLIIQALTQEDDEQIRRELLERFRALEQRRQQARQRVRELQQQIETRNQHIDTLKHQPVTEITPDIKLPIFERPHRED